MSDIDFVELDKAVNNLVNKNNAKNSGAAPGATEPSKTENERTAARPSGRFMDVFHHSSDMMGKSNVTQVQAETPPPSPRKVINPVFNDIKTPPEVEPSPLPTPVHIDENVRKNDWPDPIDAMNTQASELPAEPSRDLPEKPINTSSLFLSDTKVEKRPLGGFSTENAQANDGDAEKEKVPLEKESPTPHGTAPAAELPPELEADLVAIEEGGSIFDSGASNADEIANRNEPKPELELIEDDEPEQDITEEKLAPPETKPVSRPQPPFTPETSPPKKAELSGLLAAGSIPQQYKTSAVQNLPPEPTHPIFFDADQYAHAPDIAAHKKSGKTSVFQWIFIIVGLLLLGATLAAAVFVFVSTN